MASYRLNDEAVEDMERLFDYGIDRWGLDAAQSYLEGMIQRFEVLAAHPLQYQGVNHIREGYRRSVYGSHSIYYRVSDKRVDVMRILGRQDPETEL